VGFKSIVMQPNEPVGTAEAAARGRARRRHHPREDAQVRLPCLLKAPSGELWTRECVKTAY
jgi:hypothetical protein